MIQFYDERYESELASCSESSFFLRKHTELVARQHHIHGHEIIFWLAFENEFQLLLLSFHQHTCFNDVRTLEHRVLAEDTVACHSETQFVPLTASKFVRRSIFIVIPRLFRSWNLSCTFRLFPVGCDVREYARENDLSGPCLVFDMNALNLRSTCTVVSPQRTGRQFTKAMGFVQLINVHEQICGSNIALVDMLFEKVEVLLSDAPVVMK